MNDRAKTKEQLISELRELRKLVGDLRTNKYQGTGAQAAPLQDAREFWIMAERAGEIIVLLDMNGVLKYVNPSANRILGYAPSDLVDRSAFDFVHPDCLPLIAGTMVKAIQEREDPVEVAGLRLRDKSGRWRLIDGVITNLIDEPAVRGLVLTGRDVTAPLASTKVE